MSVSIEGAFVRAGLTSMWDVRGAADGGWDARVDRLGRAGIRRPASCPRPSNFAWATVVFERGAPRGQVARAPFDRTKILARQATSVGMRRICEQSGDHEYP